MIKDIEAPWCSWPHRENKRDPGDLNKVGARCDAWRAFLQLETIEKLKEINGWVILMTFMTPEPGLIYL